MNPPEHWGLVHLKSMRQRQSSNEAHAGRGLFPQLGPRGLGGWCTIWVFPRTPTPSRKASGIAQKRPSLKNSFSLPFTLQSREAVAERGFQRDLNWQPDLPLIYCEQELSTQLFWASPFTARTRRQLGFPGGSVGKNLPAMHETRV